MDEELSDSVDDRLKVPILQKLWIKKFQPNKLLVLYGYSCLDFKTLHNN